MNKKENHLRQNLATKKWVIFAPNRGKRPTDFTFKKEKEKLPEYEETCPFCPGNEDKLTEIIYEVKNKSTQWQNRVVPNKFPALKYRKSSERYKVGLYTAMPGLGKHEVIIESPRHDLNIAQMNNYEVELIIDTYHKRYQEIMKEKEFIIPIIFRNHGKGAGTSLIHPHSQLIATGFVPGYIRWRELEAQRYFDEWGKCVYCDIIKFELEDGRRIIAENETMLAFIPYAADVPFEIYIIPKVHESDFGNITEKQKGDLSLILKDVLLKLFNKLNNPDYNYVINSAPRFEAGEPHFHWYLDIKPRLTKTAGFEIGSGININPSIPEDDAEFLKK